MGATCGIVFCTCALHINVQSLSAATAVTDVRLLQANTLFVLSSAHVSIHALCCRIHACFKLVTQDVNSKLLLNEWNAMSLQLSCKTRLICFSLLNVISNSGI